MIVERNERDSQLRERNHAHRMRSVNVCMYKVYMTV